MPKKFSDAEKKKWLEAYENGKPDAKIAEDEGVNVRTVRSGIQEARLASQAQVVRQELLRKAIGDHQYALLTLVKKILPALDMPSPMLDVRCEAGSRMTVIQPNKGVTAEVRNDDATTVKVTLNVEIESGSEWELLQEHLKRDPMWNALNQWRRSLGAMIEARIALEKQAVASLEKRTGYPMMKVCSHQPGLCYEPLVPLVLQAILNPIFDIDLPDSAKPEATFTVDIDSGAVTHGNKGSPLARVSDHKALRQCKANMLNALEELQASPEAKRVAETHWALKDLIPRVKRSVEEVRLLNMIPGQCRICRRLGM